MGSQNWAWQSGRAQNHNINKERCQRNGILGNFSDYFRTGPNASAAAAPCSVCDDVRKLWRIYGTEVCIACAEFHRNYNREPLQ